MKFALAAAVALALSAGAARAQPEPQNDAAQLRSCALAAGYENLDKLEACEKPILKQCNDDYAQCYERLFNGWDGILNQSFRELTRGNVLERRDARNLQAAQRAWIRFRDEDCEFYAGVWPGSRPPYQLAACRHRETRERATVLAVRLEAAKKRQQAALR